MTNYYFLACVLPPLRVGAKPEFSYAEVHDLFLQNLTNEDLEKMVALKTLIDLLNLQAFFLKKPLDWRANLSAKEMEEALLIQNFFPEFVFDFLNKYEDINYRLKYFPYLLCHFFNDMVAKQTGFLQSFFRFEKEQRLILTALRARRYHRDLLYELQFEDPKDFFVAYLLAQKDMDTLTPPKEYESLKEIYENYASDPKKLHLAILDYRFAKISELMVRNSFTIDYLLGYLAQLFLVEDSLQLNQEMGEAIVESLL